VPRSASKPSVHPHFIAALTSGCILAHVWFLLLTCARRNEMHTLVIERYFSQRPIFLFRFRKLVQGQAQGHAFTCSHNHKLFILISSVLQLTAVRGVKHFHLASSLTVNCIYLTSYVYQITLQHTCALLQALPVLWQPDLRS